MRANRFSTIMLVAASLTFATQLFARDPLGTAFTYQGQLKDGGIPANGDYDFEFRLFDASTEGTQVGSDFLVNDWPVSDGLFTVELDFGGVFAGDALWLQVSVRPGDSTGEYTDLSPRQPLNAAPYALYALDGPGSGFWAASGDDIYNTNSGNVGIGTTTPAGTLEVTNDGSAYAIQATSVSIPIYAHRTSATGTAPAIRGESDSTTGNASAIEGILTSTTVGSDAAAVRAINNGTGAAGVGVWGSQEGSGVGVYGTVPYGTGVLGEADGTSGTTYGVRGRAWSPDGYGVYGDCGTGTGVCGIAGGTSGVNYGVKGETASPDGYAGYFTGGRNYFRGNVGISTTTPDYYVDVAYRACMDKTDADAGWIATDGPNGNRNVELTTYLPSYPYNYSGGASVHDSEGIEQAGMYVGPYYEWGEVWGDWKSFRVPNPNHPDTEIWYACPEGPEAAAYVRGIGHLVNGRARVAFPEHFVAVATAPGMTVQVRPLSAESKGLAVVEKSLEGFVVRELFSGTGTYDFDYTVMAVREGHEDYRVIRGATGPLPAPVANAEYRGGFDRVAREAGEQK